MKDQLINLKKDGKKINVIHIVNDVQQMYPWNDEDQLNLELRFGRRLMKN
jgi:hypothetical protein